MRHFVERRFKDRPGDLTAERDSFYACCKIVDIILLMKKGVLDPKLEASGVLLEDAIFRHLSLTMAAYGTDHIKPKHHLNHSLPSQYQEKGIFDAFVAERLHLRVKQQADRMKNLPFFSTSVAWRVMQTQIFQLQSEICLGSGLRGRIKESPDDGLQLATALQCASFAVAVGDVVVQGDVAGVVEACVADGVGELSVIVALLQWQSELTPHSSVWSSTTRLEQWSATALAFPHAWYFQDERLVLIF